MKKLAQGQAATEWQSQNLNPDQIPKPVSFPHHVENSRRNMRLPSHDPWAHPREIWAGPQTHAQGLQSIRPSAQLSWVPGGQGREEGKLTPQSGTGLSWRQVPGGLGPNARLASALLDNPGETSQALGSELSSLRRGQQGCAFCVSPACQSSVPLEPAVR